MAIQGATLAGGLAITIVFIYAIIQLLNFYDVPPSSYAVYLTFIIFLIITGVILPSQGPDI